MFRGKPKPFNHDQAWQYALRLLGQRNYSEHSLRQKLTLHSVTPQDQDSIIHQLKTHNLINDERYAQSLIRSEATYRHASSYTIAQKLKLKGIDRTIIEDQLQTPPQDTPDEVERARYHVQKFLTQAKNQKLEHRERQQKLYAYLYRKGFSGSIIKQALQQTEN